MTYIPAQPPSDPDVITQQMFTDIATSVPGWTPDPRRLDTAIAAANGRDSAELRTLVGDVPDEIAQAFYESIFQILRNDAVNAAATAQFTLTNAVTGFTIPAGTQFLVPDAGGIAIGFSTVIDVVTDTTTATVQASAITPGVAANGVTGAGQMITALSNIDSVAIIVAAAGGVDQEPLGAYLDRGTRRLQTYGPQPLKEEDFAKLAMDVDGVARALAIGGYDAAGNTTGNAGVVTVVVQDSTGAAVPGGTKTDVDDLLQNDRVINIDVRVIDPLYTNIAVVAAVTKIPSADSTQVDDDVTAALTAWLDPGKWGGPQLEGDPVWRSDPVVRINDAIAIAGSVLGVKTVTSLTLNAGTSNITLSGGRPHAIPQAVGAGSTVAVTVS